MTTIERYLDKQGRLKQWPKAGRRPIALEWLAGKFDTRKEYTESEVNNIIDESHTFGDTCLLRRNLIEQGFMTREPDGTRYRRSQQTATRVEV